MEYLEAILRVVKSNTNGKEQGVEERSFLFLFRASV